ncbi:hypothetical protein FIBSPDRAFT_926098 [Athelia psychrophila]|uniref:Glucose receptor Git3 N-terminal domain-containing protein n=1 Tax=Athelia psychrophila TaxID=1759441 RepID=A0A166TTV9_9AGAM|nr:hypothetical protein FIBSPDRAFT_926098 [Fibularhizoctonia sp. CBS 109695]
MPPPQAGTEERAWLEGTKNLSAKNHSPGGPEILAFFRVNRSDDRVLRNADGLLEAAGAGFRTLAGCSQARCLSINHPNAIAIHAFVGVMRGKMGRNFVFVCCAGAFIWFVILFVALAVSPSNTAARPYESPDDFWCWIGTDYEAEQLTGVYLLLPTLAVKA